MESMHGVLISLKILTLGSVTKDSDLEDKGLGRRKSGLAALHIWLGAVRECAVVDTKRKNAEELYRHVHSALCSVHSALCGDNLTNKQAKNKVTHTTYCIVQVKVYIYQLFGELLLFKMFWALPSKYNRLQYLTHSVHCSLPCPPTFHCTLKGYKEMSSILADL